MTTAPPASAGREGPADPVAAATHRDPYPYYAELAARRPIYRDDGLGLWVAASATSVTAVLTSDRCLVRPADEPVPSALVGSPAGAIFGRLVRMSDGGRHAVMKPAVSEATATLEAQVGESARRWAEHLAAELRPATDAGGLGDFAFQLPVYALASLLGVPAERLAETAAQVSALVRGIAPGATPEQQARGSVAAQDLIETFRERLAARSTATGESPLGRLVQAMARSGHDDPNAIAANGIGFLSQAYDATAGLIGNTLVALGRHANVSAARAPDRRYLNGVVREVVRHDPPVQNTRRFLAADGVVGGQSMHADDAVLVLLAAANRDPAANPQPALFDPHRPARRAFTFGVGPHACPGEAIATTIAEAGVAQLLACGVEPARLVETVTYRPSANTRVPLFAPDG